MLPLRGSFRGGGFRSSPLLDIGFHQSHAGTEGPEFPGDLAYLDIIVDSEIVPVHTGQGERVPLEAVFDMLSVLEILAAVVEAVLEREPGDMSLLELELDLHLPDP